MAKRRKTKENIVEELQELKDDISILGETLQDYEDSAEGHLELPEGMWDVPLSSNVDYFDSRLSYEITGYKPITKDKGLDFNPEWFTEVRKTYELTNKYHIPGSKKFREFWKEQYKRCKYGYSVNGYTITGDHYFFLNFYRLPRVDLVTKAGMGRPEGFPNFSVAQYQWFHYFEMAKKMQKHAILMKARGIGFSEINASMAAQLFTVIKQSVAIVTCHDEGKMKNTLRKVWHALAFLDNETQGGMSKNKQLKNTDLEKQSGVFKQEKGNKVATGWQSVVRGINADDPQKIRGDRADYLIYDEAGSWPDLKKAVIQGEALVNIGGKRFGIKIVGGTGGDKGPALAGLKDMYYNPRAYDALPYRHNFTQTGEEGETGFFIPAFAQSFNSEFVDSRGVTDYDKAKAELQKDRDKFLSDPEGLIINNAEYCWNAEEAFALEGQNKFNRILVAEQLAEIRLHKRGPKPIAGDLNYIFSNGNRDKAHIIGYDWTPNNKSKLRILEHPIWSREYVKQQKDKEDGEILKYKQMDNLYIAGVDGIDIGANDTSKDTKSPSDFCIIIKKRVMGLNDPMIVAIYKDRPGDIREAYKIAMCLCRYYNAKINIEATRKGFYTWAQASKQADLFVRRPKATMTNDLSPSRSNQIGTPATKQIIEQHTELTANFVEDYWHTIWFEDVLQELMSYSDENKTKFDIIAALGMVHLLEEEFTFRTPRAVDYIEEDFQDFGYWRDEKGYIHKGVIPKKKKSEIIYANKEDVSAYDPYRVNSSDPRNYQGFV